MDEAGLNSGANTGFILPLVLVSVTILSLFATAGTFALIQARTDLAIFERQVRGRVAGESGLRRIVAAIEDPNDDLETQILASDNPVVWPFDGYEIGLSIEGESGKIDFATTATEIVSRYFANLDLPSEKRAEVENRYATLRRQDPAALRPDGFNDILTIAEPAAELASDLTAHNGTAWINPVYASPRVLAAIPELSPAEIARILAERHTNPAGIFGLSPFFNQTTRYFLLVAEVHFPGGQSHIERVVIEITTAGKVRTLNGFR